MKQTLFSALLIGYVIALAGCNGNPPQEVPDAELVGTLWTLESIEVPGEPDILPRDTKIYSIQFYDDYRIEGQIDCNVYSGEYTTSEGDSMQVNIHGMSYLGCRDSDKSIENRLLGDFRAVHSFGIIGNRLQLHFDDSVLKFRNLE